MNVSRTFPPLSQTHIASFIHLSIYLCCCIMASQDSEQSDIESLGLDPHNTEPSLPDWLHYGFPDFHLPGSDFLIQCFRPASGFSSSEDCSDHESSFQSSSELSDNLEDELLGQPAIESSDDLGHKLPGQAATESSDDLEDELLKQSLAEPFSDLADELPLQSKIEPFIQAATSFSSDSIHLEETAEHWICTLTNMISQMMFVSGETSEASVETTTIIEEIVHTQVTEIVGFTSLP